MRNQYTCITLCILILISAAVPLEKAHANNEYTVGASSLNIRAEPSKESPVIGSIPRGAHVQVLNIQFDWAQVNYSGQVGWVAAYYLVQGSGNQQTVSESKVIVSTDGVRLRNGPGTNYAVVGSVAYGDIFKVIEKQGDWFHIKLGQGKSAWIAGWLVKNTQLDHPQPVQQQTAAEQVITGKQSGSLSGQTIVIDAGHGGYDPGAIGADRLFEKDLTLQTAQLLANKLKNAGAQVILTRSEDRYVHVHNRAQISQSYPSSIFISLHYNAHKNSAANGISTYYYQPAAMKLSNHIQQQLVAKTPLRDRGIRSGDFYVLRNNHQLAILVELGFITNPNDLSIIRTQQYKEQAADAITNGLLNYLNQMYF